MAVGFSNTNKPLNPRGNDASPKGYNRAALYSGKALDFDGVNDLVTGSSSSLPASGYTIAAWFNLDTLKASGVFTWGDEATSERRSLFVWDGGSGTYYLYSSTYGSNVRGNTPLSIGRWYFGAVTLTNEGEATIYLNGNQDAIGTNTLAAYTGTTYKIGDTGSSEAFDGEISGARVFNQVLTAAQIADLYNNPEKVVPTGVDNAALKLWLPMQEGAGTTAYDGSGNGNHGTISGATYVNGVGAPVAQSAVMDWNKGTNKLPDSSDLLNNTYWLLFGDTAVEGGYTAPDGTNTAFKVSGTDNNLVQQGISSTTDYRAIWARTTSGTGTAHLTSYHGNTNNLFTITEEWQKFSVDSSISTGAVNFYVVDFRGSGTLNEVIVWQPHLADSESVLVPTIGTTQTTPVLLPQGLTSGRDITGVNLFENVRKQGALNLDGNSWAEVHDNASLDFGTGSFSLEIWSKAKYITSGSIYNVLLTLGDNVSSGSTSSLYIDSSLNYTFRYDSTLIVAGGSSEGDWSHVVGVYDGTNINIYLNGSFVVQTAASATSKTNTYSKRIGTDTAGASRTYKDQIAQPRIYNRALTASEVLRNYNSGKNTYK